MVGLSKKLMELLEKRSDTLTGEDVKQITESILMAENAEIAKKKDKEDRKQLETMTKLGKEYMYGGE